MTDGLRARPPTRDEIRCGALHSAREKLCIAQTELGPPYVTMLQEACDRVYDIADALLERFSITARGDTPPAPEVETFDDAIAWIISHCPAAGDGTDDGPDVEDASSIVTRLRSLSLEWSRGVTPDPQTAAAAFEKWWKSSWVGEGWRPDRAARAGFKAGWNARAAVGDSPPTSAGETRE